MITDFLMQLKRAVLSCFLWENNYYEDGVAQVERIASLVAGCHPEDVMTLAVEARQDGLREVSAFLCALLASGNTQSRQLAAKALLEGVIVRPDDISRFLNNFWLHGKKALPSSVKKALAKAMCRFDAYQLAKYQHKMTPSLSDILCLVHPKPADENQALLFKQVLENRLPAPDTWEVKVSSGGKGDAIRELMRESRLGAQAWLMNLRNMRKWGLTEEEVVVYGKSLSFKGINPFSFVSAWKAVPEWRHGVLQVFKHACQTSDMQIGGHSVIFVDVSGSMGMPLSTRSETTRLDAAKSLAMVLKEVCESATIYTFSNKVSKVGNSKHGPALGQAIAHSQIHGGTRLGTTLTKMLRGGLHYDRLIVITDEQIDDAWAMPTPDGRAYVMNIAGYSNGITHGDWLTISGFSSSLVRFIYEYEQKIAYVPKAVKLEEHKKAVAEDERKSCTTSLGDLLKEKLKAKALADADAEAEKMRGTVSLGELLKAKLVAQKLAS